MNSLDAQALGPLVAVSHRFGARKDYVIAGGGNTSYKDDKILAVKGSGQALGTIGPEGFVQMDRLRLAGLWTQTFSAQTDEREKEVLASLMAARLPGEESKRPSVETLLHDLLPFAYVVHTHPTLVNALTCGRDGRAVFERLFGQEAVWIPLVDPGYVLAKVVKDALEAFRSLHGRVPAIVFLQNHGIVVAGPTPEAVSAEYDRILALIGVQLGAQADVESGAVDAAAERRVWEALGSDAVFVARNASPTVLQLAQDDASFRPLGSAFTPDHIVYMGVSPIRVDGPDQIAPAQAAYQERFGKAPRVVLVKGLGAFCLGPTEKTANQALWLFLDAVKIAVASQSFGGPLFMTKAAIDFIRNWEVESYRSQISSK